MTEFLRLPAEEMQQILAALSVKLGRSAQILLKDVWLCWTLESLFSVQSSVRMAFKGGTSLSKVFGIIRRFSEDVDVSLDYRDLLEDPNDAPTGESSRSSLRRIAEHLKEQVREHVEQHMLPPLSAAFNEATHGLGRIELSEDGERLYLHYPSPLTLVGGYLTDWVLVEFGGRNVTEPSSTHRVDPAIAQDLPTLKFPGAEVNVLSPERTFWEKATLVHVECHRQRQFSVERQSRHWYDLAMLSHSDIGRSALANRSLLEDVVRQKTFFFDAAYAHYDECLSGSFRLIPGEPQLEVLRHDYNQMIDAGMFEDTPPDFDVVLNLLRDLEACLTR
ncbi:MAG: nucleotidyl transferase AbiEii/AbiGii toxin family protein [Candidatus Hydrogenedentes bacterium]|nr:nucleotidyl transferase AbiEii/AbiGii toxin family protein [Candidatus Hydrogenedentota bacterium]